MPSTVGIHDPTPRYITVMFQNTAGKEKFLLTFRREKEKIQKDEE